MSSGQLQFATEVPLPSLLKRQIHEMGFNLLRSQSWRFGSQTLSLRIKRDGPMLGCHAQLSTDDGHFTAYDANYLLRNAVADALSGLELQVRKHQAMHKARIHLSS